VKKTRVKKSSIPRNKSVSTNRKSHKSELAAMEKFIETTLYQGSVRDWRKVKETAEDDER